MADFPLVISYYTQETLYELEVQNLIASCKQFDIEAHIEGVSSFGSWELNCAYKPFFILEKLKAFQRPVLWVDADGVFVRKPFYSEAFEASLAVRINPECSLEHPSRVITSTVYVAYSEEGLSLLRLWAEESRRQLLQEDRKEEFWDQIALRDVLNIKKNLNVKPLPLAFAKIFDHQRDGEEVKEAVIEHYQASRRYKSSINGAKWKAFGIPVDLIRD